MSDVELPYAACPAEHQAHYSQLRSYFDLAHLDSSCERPSRNSPECYTELRQYLKSRVGDDIQRLV